MWIRDRRSGIRFLVLWSKKVLKLLFLGDCCTLKKALKKIGSVVQGPTDRYLNSVISNSLLEVAPSSVTVISSSVAHLLQVVLNRKLISIIW